MSNADLIRTGKADAYPASLLTSESAAVVTTDDDLSQYLGLREEETAGVEFLSHLCEDLDELCVVFNEGRELGTLTALRFHDVDTQRGARSVVVTEFCAGLKLVYKQKSHAVVLHFQTLLHWLNARGASPRFRALNVLDRGTHGWVEFVESEGCESEAEVRRFYARQGGHLALLYVLEATGFQHENLIDGGEHPVLTDLEALFQPLLPTDAAVQDSTADTVLRVGLLPSFEGKGDNAADYVESFVEGFESMYWLLRTHRAELLAEDGPLARFEEFSAEPWRARVKQRLCHLSETDLARQLWFIRASLWSLDPHAQQACARA